MKSLSKRNKIVLGIVGIVVVIAVIGLVITQPRASELFGFTFPPLSISPSNSTIAVGGSVLLRPLTVGICRWSSSNPSVASVDTAPVNSPTVTGKTVGSVTITADCGPIMKGTATVRVVPVLITPDHVDLNVYFGTTLSTGDSSCNWVPGYGLTLSPTSGPSTVVKSQPWFAGCSTVTANCSGNRSATAKIAVSVPTGTCW